MAIWLVACPLAVDVGMPLDGLALFRQALFDPGEGKRHGRIVALELSRHFRDECAAHGYARPGHIRYVKYNVLGIAPGGFEHSFGPYVGYVALANAAAIRAAIRAKFSISASRSIMGIAHNSPKVSAHTLWYDVTTVRRLPSSTRPSTWEIRSERSHKPAENRPKAPREDAAARGYSVWEGAFGPVGFAL